MSAQYVTPYQNEWIERWTRPFIHGGLSPPAMYILRAHTPTASSPSVSVYTIPCFYAPRKVNCRWRLIRAFTWRGRFALCDCRSLNCGVFYALSRL